MKILHTADWHLGFKTEGRDRKDEQRKVMSELCSIAENEDTDVVIVAGDVFQNAVPTADAEELFFDTLENLSANGNRVVLVIAGNHDDVSRIESGSAFTRKHNVIIVGDLKKPEFTKRDGKVNITETGKGYIKIKKGGEKMVLAYLPYPSESRISEKTNSENYEGKVKEWAAIGSAAFAKDSFNVFASHLYLVGARCDDGDQEVKMGEALAVSVHALPKAHYTALGHMHKNQEIQKNIFYSGATFQMRHYDENPGVIITEGNSNGVIKTKFVPLKTASQIIKKTVQSIDEAETFLKTIEPTDLVILTFVQKVPLKSSDTRFIKKNYPNVIQIKIEIVKDKGDKALLEQKSRLDVSRRELFENFYTAKRGIRPDNTTTALFLSLIGEQNETNKVRD